MHTDPYTAVHEQLITTGQAIRYLWLETWGFILILNSQQTLNSKSVES